MCCYLASVGSQCSADVRINHSSVVLELGKLERYVYVGKTFTRSLTNHLGSGTGVAGIVAAALFSPQKTILTDLDDALELLHSNASLNAPCAPIEVKELDWSQCAAIRSSLPDKIDVILLSDVLYNQEKHDVLLEALDSLADENTQVLLAAKERHVDERVFWSKIQGKWDSRLLYQVLTCQIYELRKLC